MIEKTRKVVVAGVLSANSIFLGAPPLGLGFIPWFSGASLTIMHVPVIIGAVIEGPVVGAVIGFIFGLSSLVVAAVTPRGIYDPLFINPLVSVLPRLLIGPVAWVLYAVIKRIREIPALAAAGIFGSLTNTILVLSALGFYQLLPGEFGVSISNLFHKAVVFPDPLPKELIGTIFLVNGLPEAGAAAVLTVAVVASWKGIATRRRGSSV